MFSRNLTRSLAVVATMIVLALGAYGIHSAPPVAAQAQMPAADQTQTPVAAPAPVIPFTRGQPSPTQVVGQVPQDYTPGTGTIVMGPVADQAQAAAVAAYPGGIVDRVVLLSSGNYEVHIIAVNWPHHVFVNPDFTVIGAE